MIKEQCSHCIKNINIGQNAYECHGCSKIFHQICFKSSKGEILNKNSYCYLCKESIESRYNPFKSLTGHESGDDSDELENDEFTNKLSNILYSCKSYDIAEFNLIHSKDLEIQGSMLFQNIDGNKSNFDLFSTQLHCLKQKFSIIGLAETNINPDESSVYNLPGYTPHYQEIAENKAKGTGVCLYVSDSFNTTVNHTFSSVTDNLETLFLTINSGNKVSTVGVIYRPPNGVLDDAINELNEIVQALPKKSVHIIGDFNIDLHKENFRDVQMLEDATLAHGFYPLISTYTHEKPGCRKTCIDNIFSNDPENTTLSGTLRLCVSHHQAVFQISEGIMPQSSNKTKYIQYYNYCSSNVENFKDKLKDELSSSPPNNFKEFAHCFHSNLDQSCKLENPKHSKRTALNNPWITSGLIVSISTKDELFNSWQSAKKKKCVNKFTDLIDRENCNCFFCNDIKDKYVKFSNYRKNLKYLINQRKHKYISGKIDKCVGDSKKIWEIINSVRGKHRRLIKPNFVVDNKRITDRRVIANEFNKYFISLAPSLNKVYIDEMGLRINTLTDFTEFLHDKCSNTIALNECNVKEIESIIADLKPGKSSDIPVHVVKSTSMITAPVLTTILNRCMQEGYFPDELKTGRISPIYKKESEELFENYRPVSTLPIFGKIFEKIIFNRLYQFLDNNNVIYENQYGFRKGHSTNHALNYSVAYIENQIKAKKHTLGIFIDLSKAFDTLDHGILTSKLNNYGIQGNALKLIKSYLADRKQFVNVLDENSDTLPILYGVPQGSVLGPLLFILYINDISNIGHLCKIVLFADDTNIFVTGSTIEKVYENANSILSTISRYMESNLLHINTKKCCYMIFSPRKRKEVGINPSEHQLSVNGKIIKKVTETKYLGVILDEKLSWKPHLAQLNKKLKSACGRLYRIVNCLPEHLHKQLYHSLFESHLSYAIPVWGGVALSNLDKIFRTQKKCLRIMFGDTEAYLEKFRTCVRARAYGMQKLGKEFYCRESSKPLFKKHNLLTVQNIYRQRCIMELVKIIKSEEPGPLYHSFTRSKRNLNRFMTPEPSHNFTYKAPWFWNNFKKVLDVEECGLDTDENQIKLILKKSLLCAQNQNIDSWCNENFVEFKIIENAT